MEAFPSIMELFTHTDQYINFIAEKFGIWVYIILFLIVFLETGLVVTPFLPGDSLLFAAGTLAAAGSMEIKVLLITLIVAAILGDTVNYHIGKYLGLKISHRSGKFIKKEYFDRAYLYYKQHGGKTIILARFIPIIRTYVPFVAGVAKMDYLKFLMYNVVGGLIWVSVFLLAGFFFGNLPVIKDNFSLVILIIVIVSVLPGLYSWFKVRIGK